MVFLSDRTGGHEVWLKDLRSTEEIALTTDFADKYLPMFSPDGLRVTYTRLFADGGKVYVASVKTGTGQIINPNCSCAATSWSPDGNSILFNTTSGHVSVMDLASGSTRALLEDQNYRLFQTHFS
jgi:TolB protein